MVRRLPHQNIMKITSDNLSSTLLKPLDADAASAALDAVRLGHASTQATEPPRADPAQQAVALAPTRDAGESLLATDVWNGVAEGSRLLTLSSAAVLKADSPAALDQLADTILSGLA